MLYRSLAPVFAILMFCVPLMSHALTAQRLREPAVNQLSYPELTRQLSQQGPLWHNPQQQLTPAGQSAMRLLELLAVIEPDSRIRLARDQLQLQLVLDSPEQLMPVRELYLTDAVIAFASRYLPGSAATARTKAERTNTQRTSTERAKRAAAVSQWLQQLTNATNDAQKLALLAQLEPAHPAYLKLRNWFDTYRQLAAEGRWQPLKLADNTRPGDRNTEIRRLRERLTLLGDNQAAARNSAIHEQTASLAPPPAQFILDPLLFDAQLQLAVKHFQQRHGLTADGIIGPQTRYELNVTPQQRLKQIGGTLARLLTEPVPQGEHYILVNVPEFRLHYIQQGESVLDMAVIVGTDEHPTPAFSANISQIVLNPTWTPTQNIIVNELLPQFRNDPDAFVRNDYRLYRNWSRNSPIFPPQEIDWNAMPEAPFPYKLVQQAGPKNPLGRIKFNLFNSHDVYLHDTSAPWLFARTERAFSHGCIRLEQPEALAQALLQLQSEEPQKLTSRLHQGLQLDETQFIDLRRPVPVHIVYWTAWVDNSDQLQLRPDLYQLDQAAPLTLSDMATP